MTATMEQLDQLAKVNSDVNDIPYEALGVDQTEDIWIDAPAPGQVWECRDYTIAKAKALREQGWPVDDMFVVLCWIEPEPPAPGEPPVRQYHAVLGCRATDEIYILDNRWPTTYLWTQPPYPYLWAHQQLAGTTDFRDASGANGLV